MKYSNISKVLVAEKEKLIVHFFPLCMQMLFKPSEVVKKEILVPLNTWCNSYAKLVYTTSGVSFWFSAFGMQSGARHHSKRMFDWLLSLAYTLA